MNVNLDSFEPRGIPQFLEETKDILKKLRELNPTELQKLWECNSSIADLNTARLRNMDLQKNLTPAFVSYEGIQYQYMAPRVFDQNQLDYIEEHLRILSGFYGILKPFDGVVPYRLEMQARLAVKESKNLYDFWGDKLAKNLINETDCIVNLSSKEYSKAISNHLPKDFQFITCVFGELIDNKVVEKGTLCKMARGEMVRFMAEHNTTQVADIRSFNRLEHTFSEEHSTEHSFVFLRKSKE